MTNRQASAEIEVTSEMIEAGLGILAGYEPGWDSGREYVADIYRAMVLAQVLQCSRV
jgi:hypothetical protein